MINEWENPKIHGIRASRYIASFHKSGGDIQFIDTWLRDLVVNGKKLTTHEIWVITNMAQCGKMELEHHAKAWLNR